LRRHMGYHQGRAQYAIRRSGSFGNVERTGKAGARLQSVGANRRQKIANGTDPRMSIPQQFERSNRPGAGTFDPEKLEVAPGRLREGLEGWVPELATEAELREALEKAFDYRGDVTLTQRNGDKIEGYIFDRVTGPTLSASFVRVMPKNGGSR